MKILVVGAGAIGGYFGAKLAQAGRDVTFLVRGSRALELQRDGLQIVSPIGNLTIQPRTIAANEIRSTYDIILLGVKAPALDSAIADMKPAVAPQTMIYPALNGMGHMDALAQAFGKHAILGGVCMVSTTLDQQGRIIQLNPTQKLAYGELTGEITPRIQSFDETISHAGFDTELSTHIVQDMWNKWVFIATIGLGTCLFNGDIGQINSVPDGEPAILQCLDECASVANASGFPIPEPFLARIRQIGIDKNSRLDSSMFRDMRNGANVEVESILGDLLKRGQSRNLKIPLLQAGCVRLRIYQKSRSNS